jgi:hypothetical protein
MTKEGIIEASVWGIMIIALLLFVPKNKLREASLVYTFTLFMGFLIGLFIVQMKWIEYPARILFRYADRTEFTFEYLLYPAVCVLFILHYPWKKNYITQLGYFVAYSSIMTLFEVLLDHYTQLVNYIKWTWYWKWITIFLTYYLSYLFYVWFFKIKKPESLTTNSKRVS